MAGPLARLAALKKEVDEKRRKARIEAMGTLNKTLNKKDKDSEGEESCSIMEDVSEDHSQMTSNLDIYDESDHRPAVMVMEKELNKGKLDMDFICQMIDPDLNENTKFTKDEDLEEFIVLKIIRDVNLPRLSYAD
jgi:hypothetical protein